MKLPSFFWPTTSAILFLLCAFLLLYINGEPISTRNTNLTLLDAQPISNNAEKILHETSAKVVVLWGTDLDVNERTVMYMYEGHGGVNRLLGYTDQIYTNNNVTNTFMAQLMTGTITCGQINTTSKVGQYVETVGAPSICRRGILRNGVLIGYISLSYPTAPKNGELEYLEWYLDGLIDQVVKK